MQRERGKELITATLIILSDHILKFLFYNRGLIKEETDIVKNLLYFVPASQNPGIAFGLFQNCGRFFIIPASIVILFILFFYLRTNYKKTLFSWGLIFILAGAISNLIDRIIYGFVIDYLLLNKFPYSFNIADSSILLGVGLIIINISKCKNQNVK
ncbi:signal peptidase II [bacterium]|nr:signal peptidase II [bacterium]